MNPPPVSSDSSSAVSGYRSNGSTPAALLSSTPTDSASFSSLMTSPARAESPLRVRSAHRTRVGLPRLQSRSRHHLSGSAFRTRQATFNRHSQHQPKTQKDPTRMRERRALERQMFMALANALPFGNFPPCDRSPTDYIPRQNIANPGDTPGPENADSQLTDRQRHLYRQRETRLQLKYLSRYCCRPIAQPDRHKVMTQSTILQSTCLLLRLHEEKIQAWQQQARPDADYASRQCAVTADTAISLFRSLLRPHSTLEDDSLPVLLPFEIHSLLQQEAEAAQHTQPPQEHQTRRGPECRLSEKTTTGMAEITTIFADRAGRLPDCPLSLSAMLEYYQQLSDSDQEEMVDMLKDMYPRPGVRTTE